MTIDLSELEIRALVRALDNYLPELGYEVARLKHEHGHERHDLVMFDEMLRKLRGRLAEEVGWSEAERPSPQL